MTIRHLKIFLAVAETGKMSTAAEKLYISQPSVSQAIRELEEHYHILLFERLSKKLFITEAGKRLYEYARPVVLQFDLIDENMASEGSFERLRIGGTITLGSSILSCLVRDLKAACPDTAFYTYVNNTRMIEKKLLSMDLDAAVVEGQIQHPDLITLPLIKDMLVLACSASHPFAGRKKLSIKELERQEFVMRETGSGTRELFESFLKKHQLNITVSFEESTPDAIRNAIKINNCLGVLSIRLLEQEIQRGEIYVFTCPNKEWNRWFSFVRHKDKYLSRPIIKLQELLPRYDNPDYLTSLFGGELTEEI